MRLWTWPYRLRRHDGGTREGALLRIEFSDARLGFADCHPWPELGDLPLYEQLTLLSRGQLTPLTRMSLHFADIDSNARVRGTSLFDGLVIPESHALLSGVCELNDATLIRLREQGFQLLKLKVGFDPMAETAKLRKIAPALAQAGLKLRLDFNCRLAAGTSDAIARYLAEADLMPNQIDFIEDPCPFDRHLWLRIEERLAVSLALDQAGRAAKSDCLAPHPTVILKPAVQDYRDYLTAALPLPRRLVLTSYLDHPIGQLCAAYAAAKLASHSACARDICGLLSHAVYVPNVFSERLGIRGSQLLPDHGTGLGFDDLLASLDWSPA